MDVSKRLAIGLGLPTLALAVVAGYAERPGMGEAEEAVWVNTMPWLAPQELLQRSLFWSRMGMAVVLDGILGSDDTRRELTQERWRARGVHGPDSHDLLDYNRKIGLVDSGLIDAMPGAELGLLVEGAGGDSGDVIAVAAVMGRVGPGLCRAWGCEADWEGWVQATKALLSEMDGDIERFNAQAYIEACRAVAWSTGSEADQCHEAEGKNTEWQAMVRAWPRLTQAQKDVLSGLLRTWGY